jgi:hypothetical protein
LIDGTHDDLSPYGLVLNPAYEWDGINWVVLPIFLPYAFGNITTGMRLGSLSPFFLLLPLIGVFGARFAISISLKIRLDGRINQRYETPVTLKKLRRSFMPSAWSISLTSG